MLASGHCCECQRSAGFFTSLSVCYECSRFVCSKCSTCDTYVSKLRNTVTLCRSCSVITKSTCPHCAVRNQQWDNKSAVTCTSITGNQVIFSSNCSKQHTSSTVLCSESTFYNRIMEYNTLSVDMEDFGTEPSALFIEVHTWSIHTPVLPIDDVLDTLLGHLKQLDHDILLRVDGGPLNDYDQVCKFNTLVTELELKVRGNRVAGIVIELPFDRLVSLVSVPDSIFHKSTVYPCCRYHITTESVLEFTSDMKVIVDTLQSTFRRIHCTLHITIDSPCPSLVPVFTVLHQYKDTLKGVVISLQRSLGGLFNALSDSGVDQSPLSQSTSPMEVLTRLQHDSSGLLSNHDFYPVCVGRPLEGLIRLLGYGSIHLRPHPWCLFTAVLVYVNDSPVSMHDLIDIKLFYTLMSKYTGKSSSSDIKSWWVAHKTQKVLKKCVRPQYSAYIPELIRVLSQPLDLESQSVQFVTIHNQMDLGCFDSSRRSKCFNLTASLGDPNSLASSCTPCF